MLVIYNTAQASVIEFDADFFAEGDHVAVIDCMTFVPEFPGRFHLTKRCCSILQCCDMLRRCTADIPWKIWKRGEDTTLPRYIPVLKALEMQRDNALPFEDSSRIQNCMICMRVL